ncbi:UNVERIFIED_CONTAM: hypothetical protein Cloal_1158 [Acetivibrio alkalicellulosi]
MSPKNRLNIRLSEEVENEIDGFIKTFEEKTGIPTTKTAVIESALKEGLKILRKKL